MSSLADLVSDALAWIVDLLGARDIGALWICGSKLLNWKLSHGGVAQEFRFETSAILARAKWPNVACELSRLRHFSIDPSFGFHVSDLKSLYYLSLPRNLESLEIVSSNAWSAFSNALTHLGPTDFPQLKRLELIDTIESQASVEFQSQLPRGLNYVRFTGGSQNFIRIANRDFLPTSLTDLEVQADSFDILAEIGFPSTLTRIEAVIQTHTQDWMPMLPSGLLHCHVHYANDVIPHEAKFNWSFLPRGLVSLKLYLDSEFDRAKVLSLPPGLTRLDLVQNNQTIDDSVLSMLPSTLTELSDNWVQRMMPDEFSRLMLAMAGVEEYSLPRPPPNLTRMNIHYELDGTLPVPLPMTLRSLSIWFPESNQAVPPFYPPNLTNLTLLRFPCTSEHCNALPQNSSLNSLLVDGQVKRRGGLGELLNLLAHLPPNLTALELSVTHNRLLIFPTESALMLPRPLQSLKISQVCFTTDPKWFSFLPSQLTHLDICIIEISSQDLWDLSKACPRLRTFSLRETAVNGKRMYSIVDSFLHLPPSLEAVELQLAMFYDYDKETNSSQLKVRLTDQSLCNLPPNLKQLRLYNTPGLTEACLPFLPRSLLSIYINSQVPEWFANQPLNRAKWVDSVI